MVQERSPLHAGELAPLIGMHQHTVLRLASPDSGQQRLKHDVGRLPCLHGPADDAAGDEVDQAKPSTVRM